MKYVGKVSYNGKLFFGFQRQKDKRTVQVELERALTYMEKTPVLIHGSGRTDAGVHAVGQTFSFSFRKIDDLEVFKEKLNNLLPLDIKVLEIEERPEGFDARHSCSGKAYRYKFNYGERNPFEDGLVAYVAHPKFDPEKLEAALKCFVGEHDFRNFTTKKDDPADFARHIEKIEVKIDGKKKRGEVYFKGDGFMTYMIRLIMGTALRVATGKEKLEDIPKKIEAKPRHINPYKAPAGGLYLEEVFYE